MRLDGTMLAFDVGARRIGVAVGSRLGAGARGIAVVDMRDEKADWPAVEKLKREWMPAGFIVGDPLTLDGSDQPSRVRAQRFARALLERFKLPVLMVDERSSSIEAAQRFAAGRAEGQRRRRDAELLDAVAAAVILDRWIAAPDTAVPLTDNPES
ncbi:Holliday junction resolvase RuvX [Solilutibacter tolerans]|uniref:Putative pre-16S rRNA nuclease n=1 Tax=Solilutibacter tolerans TaxID=1604334 RepID=A0A1N6U020_9GAMM|nr:Holliday junction resolvase RuvX [Lysobacter tolerans]SIQ58975.1 putative holliday junction resolvase [Lysobacter tolerans]